MMLIEAQNEITKNQIIERMSARMEMLQSSGKNREMLGLVQSKTRQLKKTIEMLEEFMKDEAVKNSVDNPVVAEKIPVVE